MTYHQLNADAITGVKGDAESSYRMGNVNLTPANIGALAKMDNMLAEVRLTDVDFYTWVETVANVHTTGTADQMTQARFYADNYASYNLPCVDSHISVYSIDTSGVYHLRCIAFDIRTNAVYVNCKNGTWTGWSLLAPGTAITGISRSGTTFTATRANGGTFTFTQQDNNTTYSAGGGLSLSGTQFKLAADCVYTVKRTFSLSGGSGSRSYGFGSIVPSGYKLLMDMPFELFVSGDENAYVTDRYLYTSGSSVTMNYYIRNPYSSNVSIQVHIPFVRNP